MRVRNGGGGVTAYRLEWPDDGSDGPCRWSVADDAAAARRQALALLGSGAAAPGWVRVVATEPQGDVGDAFVTAATVASWTAGQAMPGAARGDAPDAAPELDRLRRRALAALDVVLAWSIRRHLLAVSAGDALRMAFDAALLGIAALPEPDAFRAARRGPRRR